MRLVTIVDGYWTLQVFFETGSKEAGSVAVEFSIVDISVNETTPMGIRDSASVPGTKMHPQLLSSVRPYSTLAMHIPARNVQPPVNLLSTWPKIPHHQLVPLNQ